MGRQLFSNRTQSWDVTPNPLSSKLAELRAAGKPILDLTISNPTLCGFQIPDLTAFQNPENRVYRPNAHGLPAAVEAVCRYYRDHHSINLNEKQIFITANTSEAYSFVFKLMTDPGDKILIPRPGYPLLQYLAELHDLKTEPYSSFRDIADTRARMMLAVHPNNPTGLYIPENLSAGIPLLVDEVFLDYSFTGPRKSFAGLEDSLCFTLSGISKILALPQMKISWIVVSGPEEVRAQAIEKLEIIADTYLSASTPSQNALASWLAHSSTIRAEIQQRLEVNLKTAEKKFRDSPVTLIKPEGGWYATLKIASPLSDEKWTLNLLERKNVLTHPGYLFDFTEECLIVLSLLPEPESFNLGVHKIAEFARG